VDCRLPRSPFLDGFRVADKPRGQEKALVYSGYKSRPGTGSLRPERRKSSTVLWRSQKVRVGMEASGQVPWFERLVSELQFELWIGDAAEIRTKRVLKQKTPADADGCVRRSGCLYLEERESDRKTGKIGASGQAIFHS
jgi:hypothetical protein